MLFPFAVMFITAIKPRPRCCTPTWWPSELRLVNFVDMWARDRISERRWRTPSCLGMATLGRHRSSAIPAAYALSRYRFAGRGAFRQFLLVSQMLSPIVLVIGLFRLMVAVGMIDSRRRSRLVYVAFNIAFSVWMLQSYFATIPRDLEEAAWIEGAGASQTLSRVFLPLAVRPWSSPPSSPSSMPGTSSSSP